LKVVVHSVLNSLGSGADNNVIAIPSETEFVSRKIAALKEELSQLQVFQSKIKTGELSVDSGIACTIEKTLFNFQELAGPKSRARLEADIAALRSACETVKNQLQILEEMAVYQA
jgi:hypothetical protein